MELPSRKTCLDFVYFRQLLRNDRRFDDNISHEINNAKLVDSMACLAFWHRMQAMHTARVEDIRTCLRVLSMELEKHSDDNPLLRKEQGLLESELTVEEIVQERTRAFIRRACPNL